MRKLHVGTSPLTNRIYAGHVLKDGATWLYYVGERPPFQLRWERPVGTHQIGFQDQRGKAANKPTLGKKEANATPLEFRDELLRLAMKAHNARSEARPACGTSHSTEELEDGL